MTSALRPPSRPLPRPAPFAALAVGLLSAAAAGCTATAPLAAPPAAHSPRPPATGTVREQVAALALTQVAFGAVSLIPVRFEASRIVGPFEDGGRTLYCVSSRMKGRSLGKPERPKLVVRADPAAGRLAVIDDDEVCTGRRSEPFPELERLGNPA